jgi:AcrR family transcriptional regulator
MDHSRATSSTADTPAEPLRPTLERLFDTAATLFWEKGYAATTTREIAAAVGIQQASLYYHIPSKEDLLYQLYVSSLEPLMVDVQSAVDGAADPLERIRVLARAHLATLLRHQKRHVTMLTELRALTERHRAEVVALRDRYGSLVRSVLEDAQASGMVRTDIPARYLNLALLNVLNWAVLWFRGDQALSSDQLADFFAMIFLHGAAASPARDSVKLPDLRSRRRRPPSRARSAPEPMPQSTSERLLNAAAALFSRNGYAATSTREIAALLGIQKASLYYHIGSKEDLLYAICKSSLEQIRSDVETALATVQDPLERIATLVHAHIESMLRDQNKHSAALAEMHALSAERLAQVRSLRDGYEDLVRSVLNDAQSAGALRQDIPVKYLCLSLLGLMNRVEVWFRPSGDLSPGQLGRLLAVIFLAGAAATPEAGRL